MHTTTSAFASPDITTMPMLYRSEGFAEDLCDAQPVWRTGPAPVSLDERGAPKLLRRVGPRVFGAALLIALAACVGPEAAHPVLAPVEAMPSAAVTAMPAPQMPFDATMITGVETVGASASE
ncbi:hypothetical protein BH11PSE9_BH11PSE9_23060 [soil metagenome]